MSKDSKRHATRQEGSAPTPEQIRIREQRAKEKIRQTRLLLEYIQLPGVGPVPNKEHYDNSLKQFKAFLDTAHRFQQPWKKWLEKHDENHNLPRAAALPATILYRNHLRQKKAQEVVKQQIPITVDLTTAVNTDEEESEEDSKKPTAYKVEE